MRTWADAVTIADVAGRVDRGAAGAAPARACGPDAELRAWALNQTAHAQNRPLWERLESLGIESGRLGVRARRAAPIRAQNAVPRDGRKPGLGRLTRGDVPAAKP